MAHESLSHVVLNELRLPEEALPRLLENDIDLAKLSSISKDELEQIFNPVDWNVGEIFNRLALWRQNKGFQFLGFEEVEFVDSGASEHGDLESELEGEELHQNKIAINNSAQADEKVEAKVRLPLQQIEACCAGPSNSGVEAKVRLPLQQIEACCAGPSNSGVEAKVRLPLQQIEACGPYNSGCNVVQYRHFSPQQLEDLLKHSKTGEAILASGATGPLSDYSQRDLVHIITEYHCSLGLPAKQDTIRWYSECIIALFKHERIETYFTPRCGTRKSPGGKIFSKIVNFRQKATKRKLREEAHLRGNQATLELGAPENYSAAEAAIHWLDHNRHPWTTALDKWELSYPIRKKQLGNKKTIDDLYQRYQIYREEHGYQAIDIDFRLMYGNDDGVEKWNLAFPKLEKYLNRPYKDDFSLKILQCLTSTESDFNAKTCSILLLLNQVLKPTKVTRKFKPSVLAAQEEIILFAASNDLATAVFTKFTEEYSKYGFPPVPKLVFIGKGVDSLEGEFQVRFQNFSYRFDSAIRAIDVLMKFCAVFGQEHSRISRLVWLFISAFFYNVPVKEQYECINNLKAYLLD